ncbi:MAG: cytochrome-c oxidase [Verrucomicrobia bacterium]|nr:cytochrome-c oxidase [Verrucomicrobiota bacterium]
MSRSGKFFPGIIACFAVSLLAVVIIPNSQLGRQAPEFKLDDGRVVESYPVRELGLAARGREVYIEQGCQTCHSQVVRGSGTADVERGWGVRKSVPRDFLFENPPLVGSVRIGPDLCNVGSASWRNEPTDDPYKPAKRDAEWHLLHLYQPSSMSKTSNMPAYSFLFNTHRVAGSGSKDALKLPKNLAPEEGFEIVPSPEAKALVAYLLSLDRSHSLKEVPAVASTSPTRK